VFNSSPFLTSLSTGRAPPCTLQFGRDCALNHSAASGHQARVAELVAKSAAGTLTDAERSEYEGYVRLNKFVTNYKRLAQESSGPAD